MANATKTWTECPCCTEVVSLKANGTFIRHGAEYTGMKGRTCWAAGSTPAAAATVKAVRAGLVAMAVWAKAVSQ